MAFPLQPLERPMELRGLLDGLLSADMAAAAALDGGPVVATHTVAALDGGPLADMMAA